jgi:hypothetical protein
MRKNILAIGAALALAGASAGITFAGTTSSPSFIRAYYSNKTHAIYYNSHVTHPKGTTALIWNVQGPRGATGATGPAGPSTAGRRGLDVVALQKSFTPVAGDSSFIAVLCPSDHPYVLGGGFFGVPVGEEVVGSYPEPENTGGPLNQWVVGIYTPPGGNTALVTIYALCSK